MIFFQSSKRSGNFQWKQSCRNPYLNLMKSCSFRKHHSVTITVIKLQSSAGALCSTPAVKCSNHRSLHTPPSHQEQHKTRCLCYPHRTSWLLALTDASSACSASKVRPLHDKVQSRIIKLEEDRKKVTQTSNTARKGLVRATTQRWESGANFWIGPLKKTVPSSSPTHKHATFVMYPLWWKKRRRHSGGF